MTIQASDILAVVLKSRPLPSLLELWIQRFEHHMIWPGPEGHPELVADERDRIVGYWLGQKHEPLPWLLMLDDDMVPIAKTTPLVESERDIVSARCVTRAGHPAHEHHQFTAAAFKISREAARKVGSPWFASLSHNLGDQSSCECLRFWNRAVHAGLRPTQAGIIGHRFPVTVFPDKIILFGDEPETAELLEQRLAAARQGA